MDSVRVDQIVADEISNLGNRDPLQLLFLRPSTLENRLSPTLFLDWIFSAGAICLVQALNLHSSCLSLVWPVSPLPQTGMEKYEASPHGLIQTVRNGLPQLTWSTFLAVLVFSCIATRVITGLQCRHHEHDPTEPRTARLAPYWAPWIGHGLSFIWDHVKLLSGIRLVIHLQDF